MIRHVLGSLWPLRWRLTYCFSKQIYNYYSLVLVVFHLVITSLSDRLTVSDLPLHSCWIAAGVLQWLKLRPHLWRPVLQRYPITSLRLSLWLSSDESLRQRHVEDINNVQKLTFQQAGQLCLKHISVVLQQKTIISFQDWDIKSPNDTYRYGFYHCDINIIIK